MLSLKFKHQDYGDDKLNESIFDIMNKTKLLSMSTVCTDGKPYVNTAFYSFDNDLNLYFISSPLTRHCLNVIDNSNVAVSVFDTALQFWKDEMQGVQIFGNCIKTPLLQLPKALTAFIKRFPVFESLVSSPEDFSKKAVEVKMYTIRPNRIKLFDEMRFGEEVFIDLELK